MSRKRKKEDRAKTQLKKPKTAPGKYLPKGTNETKTEFKVTKIVIPGQQVSSGSSGDGPTTSKNIGFKEVLHKLTHFSQAVRTDGLEGLKELLAVETVWPVVTSNLARVVSTLVSLLQDREAKIRKLAVSQLGAVLGRVTSAQLRPLQPLVSAHLACSLTNIDPRVQRDGLALLDTVLQHAPDLVRERYAEIIPNCLDQISNKKSAGSKGPTVAANVSENLTALQWRLDVLTRVNKILDLATRGCDDGKDTTTQSVPENLVYSPNTFYSVIGSAASTQYFPLSRLSEAQARSSVRDNIQLLLPLLTETWVEARASDNKASKNSSLAPDSCNLLATIAGILDKLLVLAATSADPSQAAALLAEVKSQFWADLSKNFLSYLPYRSSAPGGVADKCNGLLTCVQLALEPAPSPQVAAVAVGVCSSKHVPVDMKIRIAQKLLRGDQLDEDQKNTLLGSLIQISQNSESKSDKQEVLKILRKQAELCPQQEATSAWVAQLPAQLVATGEAAGEAGPLLDTCLHILQTSNKSLAAGLLQAWGSIRGQDTRLGFIKYYCDLLT